MTVNEFIAGAMFFSFIGLILAGVPIAWVLGGLSVFFTAVGIILDVDFGARLEVDWLYTGIVVERIWSVMSNWVMVALPLFVYMGLMLDRSKIAHRLMANTLRLFGRMPGGLAVTVTLLGLVLAASTGIIGASVVLLTLIGLPVLLQQNYAPSLATGTIAAAGTLGILMPPSIMLILMADRLALSVGELFIGAVLPGLLLSALYITYIVIRALFNPAAAPPPKEVEALSVSMLLDIGKATLLPLGLIFAVLGGIFFGITTPTEASGIGALGATLLALASGHLSLETLKEVLLETTKIIAFIFAILLGATAYSLVLRGFGGDALMAELLHNLPFGSTGILLFILLITFVLGFFLDWIEITLILLPLVAPVVASLGFDLVWFVILFAVCLQTSFLTPPVGFAIFYVKGSAPDGIGSGDIYRGVWPFVLLQLLGLAIIFQWPETVTWLPGRM